MQYAVRWNTRGMCQHLTCHYRVRWAHILGSKSIDSLNANGTVNVQFTSSKMYYAGVTRRDSRQAVEAGAQGGINVMHEFNYNTIEAAATAEVATAGNVTSTQD